MSTCKVLLRLLYHIAEAYNLNRRADSLCWKCAKRRDATQRSYGSSDPGQRSNPHVRSRRCTHSFHVEWDGSRYQHRMIIWLKYMLMRWITDNLGAIGLEEHTISTARSAMIYLDSGYTMYVSCPSFLPLNLLMSYFVDKVLRCSFSEGSPRLRCPRCDQPREHPWSALPRKWERDCPSRERAHHRDYCIC